MSIAALAVIFTIVEGFAAHGGGIAFLSYAAITITNAGHAFTHGPAKCPRFTLIRKSRLEWAFAGDGFRRCTFAGNGATHGCCFIATKVLHTATVVGGVAGSGREAKIGDRLTDQKLPMRAGRTFLSIATSSDEVCRHNATGGEWVAALTESAV